MKRCIVLGLALGLVGCWGSDNAPSLLTREVVALERITALLEKANDPAQPGAEIKLPPDCSAQHLPPVEGATRQIVICANTAAEPRFQPTLNVAQPAVAPTPVKP